MRAAAHNPEFAKKTGVPVSVAKEFVAADKRRGAPKGRPDRQKINEPKTQHGKMDLFNKGGTVMSKCGMKKGGPVLGESMGKVKTAAPSKDGVAQKGKTKGKQIKMRGAK